VKRQRIEVQASEWPEVYRELLTGAAVYDSSCSPAARVIYIERDGGLYLKRAAAGSLAREAEMTRYLAQRGLAPRVCDYRTEGAYDFMLSVRAAGEDCTHAQYLAEPARLAVLLGERLRMLHELDTDGCPVPDHSARYLAAAEEGYRIGRFDASYYEEDYGAVTADEAYRIAHEGGGVLRREVLLHGDYCLPNVMLDGWRFSAFIDVGNGGVGDRHVDLYWGAWTLRFNLKTDAYRARFFDAYGRDVLEEEKLRIIAAMECFG